MKKFGLDFGTTNSSISISDGRNVKIMDIDFAGSNPKVIRSMIYFARREILVDPNVPFERVSKKVFKIGEISYQGDQNYLIGQKAIDTYLEDNRNRTPGTKRTFYTGRFIDVGTASEDQPRPDLVAEYYEEIDYGTGRLLQALKSALRTNYKGTTIFGQFYSVEELIGIFLKEIKLKAEEGVGKIEEITIGRPVHFSDNSETDKRAENRLKQAVKIAGFKKIHFQFEPVAAAKQYIAKNAKSGLVFVFDFGGGTLDTAIVRSGKVPEVLATNGVYIGGDLLNSDIMEAKLWNYFGAAATFGIHQLNMPRHLYQMLQSWYSIPTLNNPETIQQLDRLSYKNSDSSALERLVYLIKTNVGFELYQAIEEAKIELTNNLESRIRYQSGPIDLDIKITRKEFEIIIEPRIKKVKEVVTRTLEQAKVNSEDIDVVVRTGGSSLIPIFENLLKEIFDESRVVEFDTFTSIAAGLSLD